jgi:hypothetical protein
LNTHVWFGVQHRHPDVRCSRLKYCGESEPISKKRSEIEKSILCDSRKDPTDTVPSPFLGLWTLARRCFRAKAKCDRSNSGNPSYNDPQSNSIGQGRTISVKHNNVLLTTRRDIFQPVLTIEFLVVYFLSVTIGSAFNNMCSDSRPAFLMSKAAPPYIGSVTRQNINWHNFTVMFSNSPAPCIHNAELAVQGESD